MNKDTLQIVKAVNFAATKHVGDKRKGENQEHISITYPRSHGFLLKIPMDQIPIWSSLDYCMIRLRIGHATTNEQVFYAVLMLSSRLHM